MATEAEKPAIGAEDLVCEDSRSPKIEDLTPSKKLKVEDNSAEEGSGDLEMEDLVKNKNLKSEEDKPTAEGDYDSEEEDYDSEWCQEYFKEVKDSEGFDVGPPPHFLCGAIGPVSEEDLADTEMLYIPLAIKAVEHYNKQQNAKLEFVKVVKVNTQPICGILYYYTICAKDELGELKTYQAKVARTMPPGTVEFWMFRPKPNPDATAAQCSASKEGQCC